MVYFDILPQLEEYSADEIGRLFVAMLEFGAFGTVPMFDDRGMRIIWREVQGKIERDNGKYQQRILDGAYGAYKRETEKKGQEPLSKDDWTKRIWLPAQDVHDVSSCQLKYTSANMMYRNQQEQGTTTATTTASTTSICNSSQERGSGGKGEQAPEPSSFGDTSTLYNGCISEDQKQKRLEMFDNALIREGGRQ